MYPIYPKFMWAVVQEHGSPWTLIQAGLHLEELFAPGMRGALGAAQVGFGGSVLDPGNGHLDDFSSGRFSFRVYSDAAAQQIAH